MKTIVAIMAAIMTLGANYAVAQVPTTSEQNLALLAGYLRDGNADMESLVVICKDDPSVSSDFQTLTGLVKAGVEPGDAQKFITSLNAARKQAAPPASSPASSSANGTADNTQPPTIAPPPPASGTQLPAVTTEEQARQQKLALLDRVKTEIYRRSQATGRTFDLGLQEYDIQQLYLARQVLENELYGSTGMQGLNSSNIPNQGIYQARPAYPNGPSYPASAQTPTQGFSMREFGKDNAGLLMGLGGAFLTKATGNSNAGWEEQVRRGLLFGPTIQRGIEGAKDPGDQSAEAWIGRGVGALGNGLGGILGLGR